MTWYIGVDPGNNGGLALIDGKGEAIEYERMPDNIKDIFGFLSDATVASSGESLVCIFEEHKGGGAVTNANAHRSAGYYHGVFKSLCWFNNIPIRMVRPQEWKKLLGANKDKQRSIQLAEQIFPKVQLIFPRCTKKHDGVAEALLIAEYGRQKKF